MAIRKEQVLALGVLVVGGLVARGYLEPPAFRATFAPKKLEYAPKALVPAALVGTAAGPLARVDFCTEPSETRPLPPRSLDFPPRSPLSLAAIPLDPGPDYGHLYALRVDGAPLVGVTIAQGGEAAPAEAAPAPAQEAEPVMTRAQLEERAARSYDRVYYGGLAAPRFGTIEADGADLFALEEKGDFTGVKLRLRVYDVTKQRLGEMMTFGDDGLKVDRIVLAGTLRNEIRRRERKVPASTAHLPERRELIVWLLEKGREANECYDKALEHAQLYRQLSRGDQEGLRLMRRVLRARGDIAGELSMLAGLATTGSEGGFRFEGMGLIKMQLGLWQEAEADFRQAVALQGSDARPHATLAEFLRRRGRGREAVASARRAEQTLGSVQDPTVKAMISRSVVGCYLAVGDVEAARAALDQPHMKAPPQPYLQGCVAYAAGDVAGALAAFRAADSPDDAGAAQLGQAACLARDGKVQEAHDLLVSLYDREPLLRHRAATGLAWLFSRTGQWESATAWVDRALEADPFDPFAFYLRGRVLRLSGQTEAALDALTEALRQRDDFVHAIAEMAAVQSALALEGAGAEQVAAAVAARRYADRAVELVASPSLELYELQGLYRFEAADPRNAAQAFARARDFAGDERSKAYAKGALAVVDYSRGLVDDAAMALQRMTQDLGRDEPLAKWAQVTLEAIDDHAQKEMLGDGFERAEVGTIWFGDADGPLGPQVDAGRLVLRGKYSRTGKGEVVVERVGAVRRGKNFLAVGAVMQLGSKHTVADAFAGLGLEIPRGSGGSDFSARIGIKDGKPFVRIEDGREAGVDNTRQEILAIDGFDPFAPQRLELRLVPRGDEAGKQFALVVSWGDRVVYRWDLKMLTGNTNSELKTVLFCSGRKGDDVDVAFDDYRLERRKEQR